VNSKEFGRVEEVYVDCDFFEGVGWRKKSLGILLVEGIFIKDCFRSMLFMLEHRVRHDFSFERSIWKIYYNSQYYSKT